MYEVQYDDSNKTLRTPLGKLAIITTIPVQGGLEVSLTAGQTSSVSLTGRDTSGSPASVFPLPGVVGSLYVSVDGGDGTGPNLTMTLTVNGVDTDLSIVVPADASDGILSDLEHQVPVKAGDLIGFNFVANHEGSGGSSAEILEYAFTFQR